MEKISFEKQQAVQAAVAASSDEILQLRQTIGALRDEMESDRIRHGEEMQSARVACREETQQLEQTIIALRDKMEKPK